MFGRREQLRTNFLERAEASKRFSFRLVATQSAGDERVGPHGEMEANLVVGLGFNALASSERDQEGAANPRREHGRAR